MALEIETAEQCRNCDEPVVHRFCPHCGQERRHRPLSLWLLMREFLEDTFSADSRLFRSLKPLLFRPGFLTNEYIAGRHASYITPFRIYLFASVLFFFVLSFVGPSFKDDNPVRQPAATNKKPPHLGVSVADLPQTVEAYDAEQLRRKPEDRDFWFVRQINRNALKAQRDNGRQLSARIIDAFKTESPKLMFFLLPVFALILKLLYVRRKRYYIEHLVFALHFHAFAFTVFAAATLIPLTPVKVLLFLSPLVYLPKAIRVVYCQSRIKTFFKTGFLAWAYGMALAFGVTALVLVALLRAD